MQQKSQRSSPKMPSFSGDDKEDQQMAIELSICLSKELIQYYSYNFNFIIISVNVEALKDVWFIGDQFLQTIDLRNIHSIEK